MTHDIAREIEKDCWGEETTMQQVPHERVVSNQMLEAAVRKACELQLFPRGEVDTDTYLKHWDGMKQCLQAALDADC